MYHLVCNLVLILISSGIMTLSLCFTSPGKIGSLNSLTQIV